MANRIMRASLRVMAKSRPVPPKPCAVEASACELLEKQEGTAFPRSRVRWQRRRHHGVGFRGAHRIGSKWIARTRAGLSLTFFTLWLCCAARQTTFPARNELRPAGVSSTSSPSMTARMT